MRVRVWGEPIPQGSMKCVGRGNRHQLVDNKAARLKVWRARVEDAGRALLDARGGQPVEDPAELTVTFTLPRPKSVRRPWPSSRSGGDLDKLVRAVGDGLTSCGLLADDSLIVAVVAAKTFPDSPALLGHERLERAGAVIRIDSLEEA